MSLFSDLPPLSANPRKRNEKEVNDGLITTKPFELENVTKKPKVEEDASKLTATLTDDQIHSALEKISNHIGNRDKFIKVSPLFRQLLDNNAIGKSYANFTFVIIKKAFSSFEIPTQPALRREYMKLCHTIKKHFNIFSDDEVKQLEIYNIVGFLQNELFTDDSFVFNKVIGQIKDIISSLSSLQSEAEAENCFQTLIESHPDLPNKEKGFESTSSASTTSSNTKSPSGVATFESLKISAEAFGTKRKKPSNISNTIDNSNPTNETNLPQVNHPIALESSKGLDNKYPLATLQLKAKHPHTLSVSTWNDMECNIMLREAILACIKTAKTKHNLAWARTSVELLIEHLCERRPYFCRSQQITVDSLALYIKQQRLARVQGSNARDQGRDETSFERAQAAWAGARVSHRGKVGASHDAKSNSWLG
mmetsp:Transcript_33334/g.60241  ORF Transcript_33334/g.60241 Transcript_33334/m.60241 type:complete len:423 (-) Transcript_33334:241-1509(-)